MRPYSKRSCLIDTLSLIRSLEAEGIPAKQAEAIAFAITRTVTDSLNQVSKAQETALREECLSAFKSELQALQSKHFLMLQTEMDKYRSDLEKKTKALGTNIEMMHGKFLASQAATTNFSNKLEREVSASKALLDTSNAKKDYEFKGVDYGAMKYWLGASLVVFGAGVYCMP
ncbi:hypothetical protein QVD17_41258 [Tagetes erecta]|uniref:Uncharacterized protein n=1 Tax=Tagetes erecta TaxID=13708 RepID=A0AAD8JQR0_TARER|nr:hypothetical protein QVD17_41253 [Tagetes erecta]KAK1409016.1 hypothetical protein QVD17_41256 [Tagetes erecta]KAK1409017.1 hypothetical protein QVD17_41258 [Tagetes erecta]